MSSLFPLIIPLFSGLRFFFNSSPACSMWTDASNERFMPVPAKIFYFSAPCLHIFSVCTVCPCRSVCQLAVSLFKHLANIISVYCNSCLCMSNLYHWEKAWLQQTDTCVCVCVDVQVPMYHAAFLLFMPCCHKHWLSCYLIPDILWEIRFYAGMDRQIEKR